MGLYDPTLDQSYIREALEEFRLNQDAINAMISILEEGSGMAASIRVGEYPQSIFTTLPAGASMAFHTNGASLFLLESVQEILNILLTHVDGAVFATELAEKTDEDAAADFQSLGQYVAQVEQAHTRLAQASGRGDA